MSWIRRPETSAAFQLCIEVPPHIRVSQDLGFFIHSIQWRVRTTFFRYDMSFPKRACTGVLADFYPGRRQSQLVARTVIVPARSGEDVKLAASKLAPELGVSHASIWMSSW